MTDEELKKEAEKYIKSNNLEWELECHRTSPIGEVIQGYTAGAEPREKRIEELESENGKLEGKLADLQSEYIELENFHNNEVNGLKAQIEELEKENAELRDKNKALELYADLADEKVDEVKSNLTKAKELITRLINVCCSYGATGRTTAEAEQFLKEEG